MDVQELTQKHFRLAADAQPGELENILVLLDTLQEQDSTERTAKFEAAWSALSTQTQFNFMAAVGKEEAFLDLARERAKVVQAEREEREEERRQRAWNVAMAVVGGLIGSEFIKLDRHDFDADFQCMVLDTADILFWHLE